MRSAENKADKAQHNGHSGDNELNKLRPLGRPDKHYWHVCVSGSGVLPGRSRMGWVDWATGCTAVSYAYYPARGVLGPTGRVQTKLARTRDVSSSLSHSKRYRVGSSFR
ncbi:hypothetical protein HD598_000602 [Neomicrococcus aestuarii]|uniref:Uncharacterized protein n=1 Tax=Neomicrococcus aestuarii TaxID=556325 RepID=A0A7W8TTR7_9MICC|nr:hypothetical protein [Neomicrococcus aestuarii]